jgi:penicillin-binding protein 2
MQMLFAYNTIANQGMYVGPKLVDSTIDADGVEHPTAAGDSHRAVSTGTADQMNLMMRTVVDEGTGRLAAINGYSVAGKTGTAQVISIGQNEKYSASRVAERHRDHSLYIAFAPADKPQVALALIVENGGFGAAAAAPIARQVFDYLLIKKGLPVVQ